MYMTFIWTKVGIKSNNIVSEMEIKVRVHYIGLRTNCFNINIPIDSRIQ